MSHHPWGRTVEIFGIQSPGNGRSCEEHPICGLVLQEDSVVRFRKVQVLIEERKSLRLQLFGCQMVSTGAELDTFQNFMSPTGSLWKALLHRLQRSTLKTAIVPQSDSSIIGTQVVQLEHSSLRLCLSVHHRHPRKNTNNMKHARRLLNKNLKMRTSQM